MCMLDFLVQVRDTKRTSTRAQRGKKVTFVENIRGERTGLNAR